MRFKTIILIFFVSCSPTPEPAEFWTQEAETDQFGDAVAGQFYFTARIDGKRNSEPCSVYLAKGNGYFAFGFSHPEEERLYQLPNETMIGAQLKQGDNVEQINLAVKNNLIVDSDNYLIKKLHSDDRPLKIYIDLSERSNMFTDKYLIELNPQQILPIPS